MKKIYIKMSWILQINLHKKNKITMIVTKKIKVARISVLKTRKIIKSL